MSESIRITRADNPIDAPPPDADAAFGKARAAIADGADLCLKQVKQIDDKNVRTEQYITYSTLLEIHLADPAKFTPDQQIALLTLLKQTLTVADPEQDEAKADLLQHIGWDLITVLSPYLLVPDPNADTISSPRQLTSDILAHIAEQCSPREIYLMLLQRLGTIDWARAEDEEAAAVRVTIELVELGKILLIAIPRITTKNYAKFLVGPVRQFSRSLKFLKHILTQEVFAPARRREIQYALLDFLLDFSERCAGLLEDYNPLSFTFDATSPDDEPAQRQYLVAYFMLSILEHGFLHLDLDAARRYYEIYHPRYTVRQPLGAEGLEEEEAETEREGVVERMLTLLLRSRISIDRLLLYRPSNHHPSPRAADAEDDDSDAVSPATFPLSQRGIFAAVTLAVYAQSILGHRADVKGKWSRGAQPDVTRRILPAVMEPLWVARRMVETAAGSLVMGQQATETNEADKALLQLLYLSDALDEGLFGEEDVQVPLDSTDSKPPAPKGEEEGFTIMKLVQTVATFASTSAHAPHRFLAHQLLSRLIAACADDARMVVLKELIERCPFEPMRAAAVGLLKQQVDGGFKEAQETGRAPHSVFTSSFLVDTFFPIVLRHEQRPSAATEPTFWDRHAFLMQALNFYLYLLIRDKEKNRTGVWSPATLKQVSREFLEPVGASVEHWSREYEAREQELKVQVGDEDHEHGHHEHHHGATATLATRDPLIQVDIAVGEDEVDAPKATPRQELQMMQSRLLSLSMMQDVIGRVRDVVEKGRIEVVEEEGEEDEED